MSINNTMKGSNMKTMKTNMTADVSGIEKGSSDTTGVRVRALGIEPNGDGTFDIILPIAKLTGGAQEMIRELFPNTTEQVYELLNREVLISAIVKY